MLKLQDWFVCCCEGHGCNDWRENERMNAGAQFIAYETKRDEIKKNESGASADRLVLPDSLEVSILIQSFAKVLLLSSPLFKKM